MKIDRILRGILSILLTMLILYKIDISRISATDREPTDEIAYLESNYFNYTQNKEYEVIEFVNKYNYSIRLSAEDINIICEGSGNNKQQDELLAYNNFNITAYFSETLNGKQEDSLLVNKKEKVYIHILTQYIGEEYPTNEVICDYDISIVSV